MQSFYWEMPPRTIKELRSELLPSGGQFRPQLLKEPNRMTKAGIQWDYSRLPLEVGS